MGEKEEEPNTPFLRYQEGIIEQPKVQQQVA